MPIYQDQDLDKFIEDIVTKVETEGYEDPYKAINPKSGALGKFQFLKTYQKEPIEKKYKIPFEEIVNRPEIQDDYFRTGLLPGYKSAAKRRATEFPDAKIPYEIMAAMQQLGPTNVKRYLQGKASPELTKQVERFLKIGNEMIQERERFAKTRSAVTSRLPAANKIGE